MNIMKRYLDILFAVLIMVIAVSMSLGMKIDALSGDIIRIWSKEFADTVSVHGYISIDMYETFHKQIHGVADITSIRIVHKKKNYLPEYLNKVFTGVILIDDEEMMHDEIMELLYDKGTYYLEPDDMINVTVSAKGKSFFRRQQDVVYQYYSRRKIRDRV